MKRAVTIVILLMWSVCSAANEIDDLLTIKDVEQFLVEKVDTVWRNSFATGSNVTRFFRADIDKNGLTDLLVNLTPSGYNYPMVVLDSGGGHYQSYSISTEWKMRYELLDVIQMKDDPLLLIKEWPMGENWTEGEPTIDTLIFEFGYLIEHNVNPKDLKVEEIVFKSDNGYGIFISELKIDPSGWATYEKHSSGSLRIFAGEIDERTFDKLVQTINYMDLALMSEFYPNVPANLPTHVSTCEVMIRFDGGQVKKIRDRGAAGTYGLGNLYRQLYGISESLIELH